MKELRIEEAGKEMKEILNSLEMPVENAYELYKAWEHLTRIMRGKAEYKNILANNDLVINRITDCVILKTHKETDTPEISVSEGCSKYARTVIETLNPKYTHRFTKKICEGDPYCESIIELKK
ncbi:hypothetical protein [Methanobacterium sp. ACI-7]|uniref:hypothetical protein n=1 Tax=unclassified Methanobacterium TaxID=2627676 RepID=UPI0039C3CD22